MKAAISLTEWQAELERLRADQPKGGYTCPELMEQLHIGRDRLNQLIDAGMHNGTITQHWESRTNRVGRRQLVPVYQFAKEKR